MNSAVRNSIQEITEVNQLISSNDFMFSVLIKSKWILNECQVPSSLKPNNKPSKMGNNNKIQKSESQ